MLRHSTREKPPILDEERDFRHDLGGIIDHHVGVK